MAEREEGLWMSARERDRLKVLHEVRKRHITQQEAAVELGLSTRWVRTLMKRIGVRGDSGLRHGLRGRRSNRKAPEELKRRAVERFRQKKQARLWHARLWTHVGGRRTGRAVWDPHQSGDAAALADRGQAVAAAMCTSGASPLMASPACALWGAGAVGYERT